MQHPKLLDIEYAANLRVHLGAKIAAHFSKIAFPHYTAPATVPVCNGRPGSGVGMFTLLIICLPLLLSSLPALQAAVARLIQPLSVLN